MRRAMRQPWTPRPRRHLLAWLWMLLLMLAAGPAAAQTLLVRGALTAPGTCPPSPDPTSAVPVTLPDEWVHTRPGSDISPGIASSSRAWHRPRATT